MLAVKNGTNKKKAIILLVLLVVIAIILAILNFVDFDALFKKDVPPVTDYGYEFYEPDYETDILSDEEYLALDRGVWLSIGAISEYGNGETLRSNLGTAIIADYLDCLINGDQNGYKKLFTDEYLSDSDNIIPEKFPQQRIYKITLKRISEPHTFTSNELDGKYTGVVRHLYSVDYLIQYNTGTVRYDIPSDSSRPLSFEIYEYRDGTQKINAIVFYDYTKG